MLAELNLSLASVLYLKRGKAVRSLEPSQLSTIRQDREQCLIGLAYGTWAPALPLSFRREYYVEHHC